MRRSWGIWVHIGVLGVAASLAWFTSGRADEPTSSHIPSVDLWKVDVDQVRNISFDATDRRVHVESKRDNVGGYAVVTVETSIQPTTPDAGVSVVPSWQKKRFISVESAEKLLEGMARFRTLRTIGKLEGKRAAEFGFDKPSGTLKIVFTNGSRMLTLGATTPGGGNYYVRDEQTGLVLVAVGEPISTIQYAEGRMTERDLHGFKTDEIVRIAVQAGGKLRQLVRVAGKANGWADPKTPLVQDETASNWVSKLSQLRATAYEEKYQSTPTPLLRVEYGDAKSNLGFVELFRVTAINEPEKFIVRSERTRWYAEVIKSQAEQIERDASLIAK